jgi:hypothetical protein
MVVGSTERFNAILQKLCKLDVSQIHFYNVEAEGDFGMPLISLIPFTNLLICEDSIFASPVFRDSPLLSEAERMNVPVLSETGFDEVLAV